MCVLRIIKRSSLNHTKYTVIYAVANPVRALLGRKILKGHLSISSNENKNKMKGTITQSTRQKKMEGHSIKRVLYTPPAANHPIPPRIAAISDLHPKAVSTTTLTPYSQGFRLLYRQNRRRLGSPWVGPINAALKRLKLAIVTPGATLTLSASSSAGVRTHFPLPSFAHAAMNLQPPSRTVLY